MVHLISGSVYLDLGKIFELGLVSLNFYKNAKGVSKISFIHFPTSRSFVLVCTKLFLFCTSFSFHCNLKENKRTTPTPQEVEKNICETIAPHAKMV